MANLKVAAPVSDDLEIQDEVWQRIKQARAVANLLMIAEKHAHLELADETISEAAFIVYRELDTIEAKLRTYWKIGE
jgi:hypothetical protein